MTTISAGDLEKLRELQHTEDLRVSIFVPPTLWTGRVNDGSAARGDRSITFDTGSGSTTYIRSYQELWVGTAPGAYDVGRVRIKSFSGTTTGTIGVAENGIVWQNNLYLTIKHNYPVLVIPPRIRSKVFYKDYDIAYSDQNSEPPPVCIAGGDRVVEIVSGGTATIEFDLTDSYVVAQGVSKSSYALSVAPTTGTTVTFNTGTGLGDIEFTQSGTFWVTASVTDDNGKSQERFVAVLVEDVGQAETYLDAQVGSIRASWQNGGTASITASGDVDLGDWPDGCIVYVWYKGLMGGNEHYVNVRRNHDDHIAMVGYMRNESIIDNLSLGDHSVSFNVQTVDGWLGNMPMRSISLSAKATPTKWFHYASWMTTGRAIHHLLRWHSTVMHRHDVYGLTDNIQKDVKVNLEEGTLFSMANQAAWDQGIVARLCCDLSNDIYLVEDIQMFNTADRAAVDTVMTLDDTDASGQAQVIRNDEENNYTIQLSGFYYSTLTQSSAYVSLMPGYRESSYSYGLPDRRGASLLNVTKQLITSQTHCNERCGRMYAHANREIREVRIPLRGNYLGALTVIPSVGWYNWDLGSLPRDVMSADKPMVCRAVEMLPSQEGGSFQVTGIFEPEVIGPDAIQGNYPSTIPSPSAPDDPRWETVVDGLPALITFGSASYYRDDDDTDWTEIDDTLNFLHGSIDPWWQVKQRSSNPTDVIWWGCGDGFVARTVTTDGETFDMTPGVDPPNTWSDGSPPSPEDLIFSQVIGTPWSQDLWFALGSWTNPTSEYRGWLAYSLGDGQGWSWLDLYDGSTLPDEVYPLWMDINGSYLLVTVWATGTGGGNDGFRLLVFDVTTLTYSTEYDLGDVTDAELSAKTFHAFPVTVFDDDNRWYVAGRMNAPQSLANPEHVILTANAGTAWSSVENSWGTDICSALHVGSDDGAGNRELYGVKETP